MDCVMSESNRVNERDDFRDALMQPAQTEDHFEVWAEETFDRLTKQTKHQKRRAQELQTDLGELMDAFEELSSYVE